MPLDELIPKNKPFEFEGLDIRPSFRASETGTHTYSINIMVTEETWNCLKTIPRHHPIGGVLFWSDGDTPPPVVTPEKPEPQKKNDNLDKREWADFWHLLFQRRFHLNLDLRQVLDLTDGPATDDDVKLALYAVFGVDSMSQVSPSVFFEWAHAKQLNGICVMIRTAEKDIELPF